MLRNLRFEANLTLAKCNNFSFTDFEDVPNIVWKSYLGQVSSPVAYYQLIILFLPATPMKMRLKAARFLQQKVLIVLFRQRQSHYKAFSLLSLCPGYICNNGGGTRAMEWKINIKFMENKHKVYFPFYSKPFNCIHISYLVYPYVTISAEFVSKTRT